MDTKRKKARRYCAVFNCLNTDRDGNLTFFLLPKESDRRKEWLEVIDRPDLLSEKHSSHYVRSQHFDKSQIIHVPKLVPDAVPMKLLPNKPNTEGDSCDVSTQTNILSAAIIKGPDKKSSCSKTASENKTDSTQTLLALSSETPRQRQHSSLDA